MSRLFPRRTCLADCGVRLTIACWLVVAAASAASAAVQTHALFSDNAVLQQGRRVPVWGTTDRATPVKVSYAGHEVTAMPVDGKWRVDLPSMNAGGGPQVLVVSQDEVKIERQNVVVGEVWLCGGQSNMQWAVSQSTDPQATIDGSANENLRLIDIPRKGAPEPQTSVEANWTVCGPQTVANFTAVGHAFGADLQKSLKVPVGLISSNLGGTTAERWMSKEALASHPGLQGISSPQGANDLYNAMIAPLAPYGVRGAIWYQGESNADRAIQYRTLLPAMIRSWRETFGQGDLPFYQVQLAPFTMILPEPGESNWAELREAQVYTTLVSPNTGIAVITDLGDEKDIHPQKKKPVGERLALCARALTYGENVEYSGPRYERLDIDGNRAIISFSHVAGGLVAKDGELKGFTLAGADRKFHHAKATIEGKTVVITCDAVPKPLAVRFGWANYPVVNLFNSVGLPASPFRTDDFPAVTQDKK